MCSIPRDFSPRLWWILNLDIVSVPFFLDHGHDSLFLHLKQICKIGVVLSWQRISNPGLFVWCFWLNAKPLQDNIILCCIFINSEWNPSQNWCFIVLHFMLWWHFNTTVHILSCIRNFSFYPLEYSLYVSLCKYVSGVACNVHWKFIQIQNIFKNW